ncbi:uncharacterized protein [Henckelia pumila]|uniref:uncharacterized protein n=1 Tax=Henckelia pumila TaxID=405737 RepID=UPI003C6E7763
MWQRSSKQESYSSEDINVLENDSIISDSDTEDCDGKKEMSKKIEEECAMKIRAATRDSSEEEFPYDPDIERTLRREARRIFEEEEEVPFEEPKEKDGCQREDPHKHLMEFHVICTSIKPRGVTGEQIQLRVFSFSLKNAAKDWLYYLPPGSITTWAEMKRTFLEKYFPALRAANIRKEIYVIKQYTGESLHENMLDAASGRVFVDKSPIQARNLIENMTANSQQFGTNKSDPAPRRGNEVNVSSLEQKLIDLTSLVRQMAVGNGQNVKNYDPYSNTFNPGWKDHPNFRYGNPPMNQLAPYMQPNSQAYMPPYPPQPQRLQIPMPGEFLENIVKDLATNTLNFQQEMRASIQHLNTQVGQLATAINRLEAKNSSSLPSHTVVNPKENVSAITLRSGRELKVHEEVAKEPVLNEDDPRYEVNIPLLDAIKQVPRYAKYLKELCTVKRKHKLKGCQKVELGEQVSVVIQRKVPTKCKDPGPLNETTIIIQMADRSTIYPRGVLEDVLVQVDVNNGTLTMEFDGEVVKFNIFDTLKIPSCESVVNTIDVNNHLSLEYKEVVKWGKLKEVMAKPVENFNAKIFISDLQASKIEPKLPPD